MNRPTSNKIISSTKKLEGISPGHVGSRLKMRDSKANLISVNKENRIINKKVEWNNPAVSSLSIFNI